MDKRIERGEIRRTLIKELVDCRNRAELLSAMAAESQGQIRTLYSQLAASFEHSASLIEKIKKQLKAVP